MQSNQMAESGDLLQLPLVRQYLLSRMRTLNPRRMPFR